MLLLADGRSDPQTALAAARAATGTTRLFAVGLGDQVSKALLSKLAAGGGGRFLFIDGTDILVGKVVQFFGQLEPPLWVGTSIEVNGRPLQRAYPRHLTDIFPGDELRVSARFAGSEVLHIAVHGSVAGQATTLETVIEMPSPLPGPP